MNTREWTAIHRKHHALCETAEDPHSPVKKGLAGVLWQSAEMYKAEAGNSETLKRFGHRTPRDWLERKQKQTPASCSDPPYTFWPGKNLFLHIRTMSAISQILEASHTLKTIYKKKKELQAIWLNRKGLKERTDALTSWCHQAESSGIKVLQDFSVVLKTYTLSTAI